MKLNDNLKFVLGAVIVILSIGVQIFHPRDLPERTKIFYDCRASESPNTPQLIKEECRRLREGKK